MRVEIDEHSGLMIYAKDKQTELALEDDWHHNVYDRRYVALVSGEMEEWRSADSPHSR